MTFLAAVPPESSRPDEYTLELLEKQVDRYQAIVARLANDARQVKTWCVTLVGAVAALAVNSEEPAVFMVALILLLPFAAMDTYYLALERHFRRVSTRLIERTTSTTEWSAFFQVEAPDVESWRGVLACAKSKVVSGFYPPLGALLALGWVLT